MKLLIVDDNQFARILIRRALEDMFEFVEEAVSTKDALFKFKNLMPDVVTLDVVMEGNSMQCLKEMLSVKADVKVIVVSALKKDDLIKMVLKLGVVDYIVKPFSAKKLRRIVLKACGNDKEE